MSVEFLLGGRMFGKLTAHKQTLGNWVYEGCNGGKRVFFVAGRNGIFRVKITKVRRPRAKIEIRGSNT